MMTTREHLVYWRNLARSDLEVARRMLKRGKDLHDCLFFGHLCLEKLLKGLVVAATRKTPPPIHDLVRLAKKAGLILDEELEEKLFNFNKFNLEARYPDYKLAFYKSCTQEFVTDKFSQIEEVFTWLESQYAKQFLKTSND